KWRQFRQLGHTKCMNMCPQNIQWVFDFLRINGAIAHDRECRLLSSGFKHQTRLRREKAIAPHLLATDHAFEQARASTIVDLMKRAHRREHVTQYSPIYGHIIRSARELRKSLKLRVVRHTCLKTACDPIR